MKKKDVKQHCAAKIEMIALDKILPSEMNPRKMIDDASLRELAENISVQGLLNPITVRPKALGKGVEYEIVCGERRWRACSLTDMQEIACIVRELSDDEAFDAMVTENLQRKDVSPMEEARAFKVLAQRAVSEAELSARFGRSLKYVKDRISLNSLLPELQDMLDKGELPITSALLLSRHKTSIQKTIYSRLEDCRSHGSDISFYSSARQVKRAIEGCQLNLDWSIFLEAEKQGKLKIHKGGFSKCSECPWNSSNANTLFPELSDDDSDEGLCYDEGCYCRKVRFWFEEMVLSKIKDLAPEGTEIDSEHVFVMDPSYFNRNTEIFHAVCVERKLQFITKESLGNCHDRPAAGLVKVLDLGDADEDDFTMSYYDQDLSRKDKDKQTLADDCRIYQLREKKTKTLLKELNTLLEKEGYEKKTGPLEKWEDNMLAAVILWRLPIKPNELEWNFDSSYDTLCDFLQKHGRKDCSWKRAAIKDFISNRLMYLKEAAGWVCGDAATETMKKIEDKFDSKISKIKNKK